MKSRLLALSLALSLLLALTPGAAHAASAPDTALIPAASDNWNDNNYTTWSQTVKSYLYQDGEDLVRAEYLDGRLLVERYNRAFDLLSAQTVELDADFPLWGGLYAGEDYNFVILGRENPQERDDLEVIRVIQYDKAWNRLGDAGLSGINTVSPFSFGSLRCAEYGGILYVRTSHTMYTNSTDGLNHQANLMFSLREDDMAVTDVCATVMNASVGYVSHSFNQFLLVDQRGNLVALDHGDAHPRSAVLMRYGAKAGGQTFRGQTANVDLVSFPGETGENDTGASLGGLAETAKGYVAVLNNRVPSLQVRNIYLTFTPKDRFSASETRTIALTGYGADGGSSGGTPVLAPTGLDGGYVLWAVLPHEGSRSTTGQISYVSYSAAGGVSDVTTVEGALSDCQPIVYNGKVTWYVTHDSAPIFYTLDENGLSATHTVLELDDVSTSDWYYAPVKYVYDQALMDGVSGTAFQPGGLTTRGMAAAVLWRLSGSPAGSAAAPDFTDVPAGSWYRDAVRWAASLDLVGGYGDGRFGPDDPVTREQLAAMLYRYAQHTGAAAGTDAALPWSDAAATSDWAYEAVAWCTANGILGGRGNGVLDPGGYATRAELAAMLTQFCTRILPE